MRLCVCARILASDTLVVIVPCSALALGLSLAVGHKTSMRLGFWDFDLGFSV